MVIRLIQLIESTKRGITINNCQLVHLSSIDTSIIRRKKINCH